MCAAEVGYPPGVSEEPRESVLVVEDDAALSRLLQVELKASGFDVRVATDGQQGLDLAQADPPDLVLADVMMPNMTGYELARRLREDPRTAEVSIIMVTARGMKADKLEGLTSGADDYVVKPFDNEELLARVRGVLRRAKYMRSQSPLTGLPGNLRIEDEIQARVDSGEQFAVMYLDLDNFKSFSDSYGFVRGDEALRATSLLIRDVARAVAGVEAFVGHIGGDDFVILVDPSKAEDVGGEIMRRFDELSPTLYVEADAARGYLEGQDRQGNLHRFPLLSVSIGVATTAVRSFAHRADAVEVATEMKNLAKRTEGSSLAMDRRRGAVQE